jgi:hypothetical protein
MVPKLNNICLTMKNMHNEIGHFGEAKMLVEIKKWFSSMIGQITLKNLSRFVIDANWLNTLAI